MRRSNKVDINKVTKLVFNGGGVKGGGHVMAYMAFIACGGKVSQITDIAGTSAGSIVAALTAVGYTPQELYQEMTTLDFMRFLDEDSGLITVAKKVRKTQGKLQQGKNKLIACGPLLLAGPKIRSRIIDNFGVFKGEVMRQWLEQKISAKTGIQYCTFKDLHQLAEINTEFKDLHVVAINCNTQTVEYFSYNDSPKVIISDAVRASASIPIFFEAHQIHIKNHNRRIAQNEKFIDGGVINNYPLNIFKEHEHEVLGFYLCDKAVAKYLSGNGQLPDMPIHTDRQLLASLVGSIYDQQYATFMADEKAKACTIAIDNKGISEVDFDLSNRPNDLQKLLRSGWKASGRYFGNNIPFPPNLGNLDQYVHYQKSLKARSRIGSFFHGVTNNPKVFIIAIFLIASFLVGRYSDEIIPTIEMFFMGLIRKSLDASSNYYSATNYQEEADEEGARSENTFSK